ITRKLSFWLLRLISSMISSPCQSTRGPEKIQPRVDWQGLEIIEEMRRNNEKVIFLVITPHLFDDLQPLPVNAR
ncbi:hypothetical protein PSZ74_24310, partial [Shigella sonnei]|nr:hypothetical protein [Shigella sonnei]